MNELLPIIRRQRRTLVVEPVAPVQVEPPKPPVEEKLPAKSAKTKTNAIATEN